MRFADGVPRTVDVMEEGVWIPLKRGVRLVARY